MKQPDIHIINPFAELGGSELRALNLYEMLRPYANVQLWSEYEIDSALAAQYPIQKITWSRLNFPKSGTFIFVGVYYRVGRWYYLTQPQRVILVNNILPSHSFGQRMRKLTLRGLRRVEVVYPSIQQQRAFAYPGVVEISPIDIGRFRPASQATAKEAETPFVVGRHSRDVPEKFHADDPAFFRRLCQAGMRVKLLGGTCLAPALTGEAGITIWSVGARPAHEFLQGLDCFFYRTAVTWLEPFGRVVIEAMACGLPVVCENRGGYTEVIDNGRDGFLFAGEAEAYQILMTLRQDRALRQQVGLAARQKVETLFSPEARRVVCDYYLKRP